MNEFDPQEVDLFADRLPIVPDSHPPTIAQLHQRRKRQLVARRRMVAGGCAAAMGMLLLAVMAKDSKRIDEVPSLVHAPTATDRLEADNEPVVITSEATANAEIRVLATFSRPVAVFDVDQKTQLVRHVGWIESRETVSVDLNEFPEEQRQSIVAAMTQETPPTRFINL